MLWAKWISILILRLNRMRNDAIGGYFGLEIRNGREYHPEALRLNTGRHALEYVLKGKGYKKIYLPHYTCDVLFEPVRRLGVEIEFYSIDEDFTPIFDFSVMGNRDVFLYTNYFGICSKQTEQVVSNTKNLIIDNAQSFFSTPYEGVDTFYSARKFFGVPDGAYLYTDKKMDQSLKFEDSNERFEHVIKRIDRGAEAGYKAIKKNDSYVKNASIKKMSKISCGLLEGIDYEFVKERRRKNFIYLQQHLNRHNELETELGVDEVPLAYPFLTDKTGLRELLIENKVFVPVYWPHISQQTPIHSIENRYSQYIIPLPIDQRYDIEDMSSVTDLVLNFLKEDRKSTRLNSSHVAISYAVFCLKKKTNK